MSIENIQNKPDPMDKPLPLYIILLIPIYVVVMFSVILFPISKDWGWLEAWLFIVLFAINIGISYFVINKKNPRVIRNRMKTKKRRTDIPDKEIRWIGFVYRPNFRSGISRSAGPPPIRPPI